MFLVGWIFFQQNNDGVSEGTRRGDLFFLCFNGCENVWVGGCDVLGFFLAGRCSFAL